MGTVADLYTYMHCEDCSYNLVLTWRVINGLEDYYEDAKFLIFLMSMYVRSSREKMLQMSKYAYLDFHVQNEIYLVYGWRKWNKMCSWLVLAEVKKFSYCWLYFVFLLIVTAFISLNLIFTFRLLCRIRKDVWKY